MDLVIIFWYGSMISISYQNLRRSATWYTKPSDTYLGPCNPNCNLGAVDWNFDGVIPSYHLGIRPFGKYRSYLTFALVPDVLKIAG